MVDLISFHIENINIIAQRKYCNYPIYLFVYIITIKNNNHNNNDSEQFKQIAACYNPNDLRLTSSY